jgi:hypothetical protein
MEQYISKAAVLAEINRVLNSYDPNEITSGRYSLVDLRDFLDTLEVKEADLEKEMENIFESTFRMIAKHFFDLGLKSQVMTPKLQQRIGVLKMDFWTGLQTFEETEMTLSDAYNQGVDDILEELGIKTKKEE